MHYDVRLLAIDKKMEEEDEYFDERTFFTKQKQDVWKYISPELYCIFWYMSLPTLVVPTECYQNQIQGIHTQMETLKTQKGE